jgi:hypothetical protein
MNRIGFFAVGIVVILTCSAYANVHISISPTLSEYIEGDDIVLSIEFGINARCVTFDPTIAAGHYSFVVRRKDGSLVEPKPPLIIYPDRPVCNDSVFCGVSSVVSNVVINRSMAESKLGVYEVHYLLPPGEYDVTVFYDARIAKEAMGGTSGCPDLVNRDDFLLYARSESAKILIRERHRPDNPLKAL